MKSQGSLRRRIAAAPRVAILSALALGLSLVGEAASPAWSQEAPIGVAVSPLTVTAVGQGAYDVQEIAREAFDLLVEDLKSHPRIHVIVLDRTGARARLADSASAGARAEPLIPARFTVTGVLLGLPGALRLDLRLIDTDSGNILTEANQTAAPDQIGGAVTAIARKLHEALDSAVRKEVP